MQVICPKCGNAIAGADLDLAGRVAVCRPCGEVVPFPQAASLADAPLPLATRFRPDTLQWRECSEGASFEAIVPPTRASGFALLIFALIWDGAIGTFYVHILTTPNAPLIARLFPLGHVGVGFFVTYQAIKTLLNSTRVSFDDGIFRAVSGPIPSRGNITLPVSDIVDFRPTNGSTRKGSRFTVVANAREVARTLPIPVPDGACAEYVAARLNEALSGAKRWGRGGTYRT